MSHKRIVLLICTIILVAGITTVWQLWTNTPNEQQHSRKERNAQNAMSVTNSFENERITKADAEPQAPQIMPEYFRIALENPRIIPKLRDMPAVEPWVKQELINQYKSLGSLTNKMHTLLSGCFR